MLKSGKKGSSRPDENKFSFNKYAGQKGLRLSKLLSITYSEPNPINTQFVFVGVLKKDAFFHFNSPQGNYLYLTVDATFLKVQYGEQPVRFENQRLPKGFTDKRVFFTVKFTRVGVACNITDLEDNDSHSFTFTNVGSLSPVGFTTVELSPPKDGSFLIEFFGLTEGDNLTLLHRFLMEEIYRK